MRAIVMLVVLLAAATCYAEDPLETLNTVEDTVTTMEHTLQARKANHPESLYFISEEEMGSRGWVSARQCSEERDSCLSQAKERETGGSRFWKSRLALPTELHPGVLVVAQQDGRGEWVVAKVTGTAELQNGYVEISAPFKGKVGNLRVVEE